MKPTKQAAVALVALLTLTACSGGANYGTRMAYLRKTALRGVETHNLIVSQGTATDAKRCAAAYEGLQDNFPSDTPGGPSIQWSGQVKQFFVDSCVTGLPKPLPGTTPATTPTPAPVVSTSPTPTPSR